MQGGKQHRAQGTTSDPLVSVIVPIYNDADRLPCLIACLERLSVPREQFEVLLVDNGSSDESLARARAFAARDPGHVRVLVEADTPGSYAARNMGIGEARGRYLAFTDSDCQPAPQWLEEGTAPLLEGDADLVGGHVEFTFGDPITGAELYDSVTHMQTAHDIATRQVAKTANLFVKRDCFDELGLFPTDMTSGGDIRWTGRATRRGYELVYSPTAVVTHPARTIKALLRKQVRTGYGYIPTKHEEGRSALWLVRQFCRHVLPPHRGRVAQHIGQAPLLAHSRHFRRAWWACWGARIAAAYGLSRYCIDRILGMKRSGYR